VDEKLKIRDPISDRDGSHQCHDYRRRTEHFSEDDTGKRSEEKNVTETDVSIDCKIIRLQRLHEIEQGHSLAVDHMPPNLAERGRVVLGAIRTASFQEFLCHISRASSRRFVTAVSSWLD
jgi:hypothetical protein